LSFILYLLFSKLSLMFKTYSGVGRSGLQIVLANLVGAPSLISFLMA
jgi:hypothetical protein